MAPARRDALLDTALALLREGGLNAVTMESVATCAGVSRPLVYKHFANREDLLSELWRRESQVLFGRVQAAAREAETFEDLVRRSVRGVFEVLSERGSLAPLLHGDGVTRELRLEQQAAEQLLWQWYAERITRDFAIAPADAEVAVRVYFAGLESMLSRWRPGRDGEDIDHLVEVFVRLLMGGLRSLQDG